MKIYVVLYGEDDEIYGVLKAFGDGEAAKTYKERYDYRGLAQQRQRSIEGLTALPLRQAFVVTTDLERNGECGAEITPEMLGDGGLVAYDIDMQKLLEDNADEGKG